MKAGDKELLDGVDFALERAEHVALVGPNGSGKTTLLETMLGRRDGAGKGAARARRRGRILHSRSSSWTSAGPSSTACRAPPGFRQSAQNLLGRFLFSGWDEQSKPVTVLWHGSVSGWLLAIVVASGANFLVLDEPTNHLDLESREALEAALEAFPGTVLLVSHDRALLDAVAQRTLAIEERKPALVRRRLGGADSPPRRGARAAEHPAPKVTKKAKTAPVKPAGPTALQVVEADIERQEAAVADLERSWRRTGATPTSCAGIERRDELQALLARWSSCSSPQVSSPSGRALRPRRTWKSSDGV